MLHIRCGDDILPSLDAAGLPGDKVRWADPLCEGPTPAGLDEAAFRAVRTAFLAGRLGLDAAAVADDLARQDDNLGRAADADEVVLWFEHDLFDQIILVHLLDRLKPLAAARMSLVCIDRHPAVARFRGLGQLEPEHFPDLFAARQPVTEAQFALASAAWAAFTAPDPSALEDLRRADTSALPFLAAALERHLQQFPWKADGLALTEWMALDAIDLLGAGTPWQVFRHVQARETAPWQGDIMHLAWLRTLAREPDPLLLAYGTSWPDDATLALTERGRAVLFGKADALETRPLDRWVGGVHLAPGKPQWRWDAGEGALTPVH